MKIPEGSFVAETEQPLSEALASYGQGFRGCIRVMDDGKQSEGFVIVEGGKVLASAFTTMGITLYQMSALERMTALKGVRLRVCSYTEDEKRQAFASYPDSVIDGQWAGEAVEHPSEPERISYDALLATVARLPGVIAAALVIDGLPIYQQGQQVDFEHIAVATEDMVRSGTKIATELQLGSAEQIILETPSHKAVIAPISDMFLCVLTAADANLGLVRLGIKNLQANVRDR